MATAIAATQKEAGCRDCSCGLNVVDPDTIIVLESWESAVALEAHFKQPNMAERIGAHTLLG